MLLEAEGQHPLPWWHRTCCLGVPLRGAAARRVALAKALAQAADPEALPVVKLAAHSSCTTISAVAENTGSLESGGQAFSINLRASEGQKWQGADGCCAMQSNLRIQNCLPLVLDRVERMRACGLAR